PSAFSDFTASCMLGVGQIQIDNLTTGSQQACQHRGSDHWAGWSRVAANKNSSTVEVCSKTFGKVDCEFWSKGLTDNSSHAGDADFQRFHRSFELNISGSWACRT